MGHDAGAMRATIAAFTVLFRLLRALSCARSELALENVAVHQQLTYLARKSARPRLDVEDRALWIVLRRTWDRWSAEYKIYIYIYIYI